MVARYCSKCPAVLLPQDFYRHRTDGFQRRCKTCQKAGAADWQTRNRGRRNATVRTYAKRNPDKMAERSRIRWEAAKKDPEALALWRDRNREHKRKVLGITPDRYRVTATFPDGPPRVPTAPVLAAVADSGLLVGEVEMMAGVGGETIRKARGRPTMRASTALAILNALGCDPVDVGI